MKLGRTLTQCYDRCHRMPSPTPLCISFFGQIGSHWKTLLPRMVVDVSVRIMRDFWHDHTGLWLIALGLAKSQSCSELWEGYNLVAPEKIWFVDTAFTTFEGRLAYRFAMRTSEILPLRRVCQVSINTFGVGGTFATQFYSIRALPFNWQERSSIWTELTAQLSALSGIKVGLMHCFHTANWVADYMTSPSSRSSSKIIEVGLECLDTHKKESKERWYDEFLWLYIRAIGGSWCQIENRNLPHLQVPVCSTRTIIYPNQYGEIPLSHPIILVGKWPSPLLWFRNVYIYIHIQSVYYIYI